MKKTREMMTSNLKLVDLLIEVIDARIPQASRNPVIDEIAGNKKRVIVLNKSDLSDSGENRRWLAAFQRSGHEAFLLNSMSGEGTKTLTKALVSAQERKNSATRVKKPLRLMVAGVPNVGKSSLINRLVGRKSARIGDKPGVTRGKQWLALESGMQLLDTPGILWPKFEDPDVGIKLAICGAIKDETMELEGLALELLIYLIRDYPDLLDSRYRIDCLNSGFDGEDALAEPSMTAIAVRAMESVALKRGYLLPGKRIDCLRASKSLLDDFRSAAIGRITLERAPRLEGASP